MKAILENLRLGRVEVCDVPPPELRPGGVLVHTLYSAISAGTECRKLESSEKSLLGKALARPDQVRQVLQVAKADGVAAAYLKVKSRLDSLSPLGYSAAGVVLEVGQSVGDLRRGDRVACGGAGYANHSEVNFVPRNLVVRVPDPVDMKAASFTTIGAIAIQGLRQAEVRVGETVAVIGAGLVGLIVVQLARAAGCRVLALDVDPGRAQFAREFGAHLALVADEAALATVRQFSDYGVDAAIVAASAPSAAPLELASEILRDRGRIVVVGDVGMGVARRNLYAKELSIVMSRSYGPGRYDPAYEEKGTDYPIGYVRWTERRNMEAFVELLASGAIDISRLTAHQCNIEDAESAYALIREKKAYTVVLTYPSQVAAPTACAVVPAAKRGSRHGGSAVNVSCIGAGGFARAVVFPHLAQIRDVKLHAVATSSGSTAESARRTFGFAAASTTSEVFADEHADAVFVLSRHDTHAQYVAQALKAGKAAYCEKPLAVNRHELTSLSAQYERCVSEGSHPFVMVGFNRRFAPFTNRIREFLADRREPLVLHMRINAGPLPREHWTHGSGGRIVGEACHFIDLARALINSPIDKVSVNALPDNPRYNRDNIVATISFCDGSLANLIYLANGDNSVPKELYEIFCAGSVARLDDFRSLELIRDGRAKMIKSHRDKGHRQVLELTVDAIRNSAPAPIPFAELVEVTEATLRVAEAVGIRLEPDAEFSTAVQNP